MKRIIPFLLLAFALAACQDEGPASPADGAQFAKGGDKPCTPWPQCKDGGSDKLEWVPLSVTFEDAGYMITSDGRGSYEYGECGVRAGFPPNPGGDAIVATDRWPIKQKDSEKCGGREARSIEMHLGSDGTLPATFMNIDAVQGITSADPVPRKAVFLIKDFCTLLFDEETYPGSDNVEVSQNTDGTSWTVRSGGDHIAYCKDGVRSYVLRFQLTVSLIEN